MSLLGWLGLTKDLAAPIEAISDLYTTDDERLKDQQKLDETLLKPTLAQIDVNRVMASSANFFEFGWQPLIGWTCGLLICLFYAPQIIIVTWVWGSHCISTGICMPFPMSSEDLMNLVYLLFGFGTHSLLSQSLLRTSTRK